jgi:uncharacterized peroxidase-related enzyme
MFFIETIEEKNASPALQQLYEKNKATLGYIANYTRLFSHRPEVMVAWINLVGSIRDHVDQRRYELITLAAAKALKSSYCALAHGAILHQKFYSAEQLGAIVSDYHHASLSAAEITMMSFAEKIVREATCITGKDVDELRSHGFSDAEIFDITTIAAARCFFSKTLDALSADPDPIYHNLEDELKKSLTVGRSFDKRD